MEVVRGVVRRVVRGVVRRVVRGAGSVGSPRIGGQSFLLSRVKLYLSLHRRGHKTKVLHNLFIDHHYRRRRLHLRKSALILENCFQ